MTTCLLPSQKRIRGILTRKRFQPLVKHRCFLSKEMTKIQTVARMWLARRRVAQKKQQKLDRAATKIQRLWRAYKDRQYVTGLRADKAKYDRLMRSAVVIQSGVRMALARREYGRRKLIRWAGGATTIQRQVRVFLLRKELHEIALRQQPVQAVFSLNLNSHRTVMPWSWKIYVAPWADAEPGEEPADGFRFVDIFNKVGVTNWQTIAIVNCQKMIRGHLARGRISRLKTDTALALSLDVTSTEMALCSVRSMVDSCLEEASRRRAAAIKIQSHARGFLVRRKNLIFEKRNAAWAANLENIVAVQAFFKRYLAQEMVVIGVLNTTSYFAATQIQTAWRGWLARRHVERLREEALWPLKGWFEFTATGREAVQVEVCFLANPSFNDYKYFLEYGSTSTLQLTLKALEADLASAVTSIQGNPFIKEDNGRWASSKDTSAEQTCSYSCLNFVLRLEIVVARHVHTKKEQRIEEAPEDGDPKIDKKEAKNKAKAARKAAEVPKDSEAPAESEPRDQTAAVTEEGEDTTSGEQSSKPGIPAKNSGRKEKKPQGTEPEGDAAKPKAAAKGSARKGEDKKESAETPEQPPKPSDAQPKPPTLGADGSVREMSQSTQANELRKTKSTGALDKPPDAAQGKNYAGTMKNGKFEKKKVDSIEALSKDERAAIMADIEEEKQKKMQALQEKQKQQAKRTSATWGRHLHQVSMKKEQEAKVQQAQRSKVEEAEALEEERRKQKVQELKKWLKQKEDQDRAKKERDATLMQELQDKESQKQEQQKVLEQQRTDSLSPGIRGIGSGSEQRDKRLQAVAKQKAKLEAQLLASREAAIQEKINASQRTDTSKPSQERPSEDPVMKPPEETDPRMRKQQLLIQQQLANEQTGYSLGMPPGPGMPGMPQRIVHRHIHHHVHYHEGDGEEAGLPSLEERRRIEQASEDRVKQKLAEQELEAA
eukprot:g2201.t1